MEKSKVEKKNRRDNAQFEIQSDNINIYRECVSNRNSCCHSRSTLCIQLHINIVVYSGSQTAANRLLS